MQFKHPELLWAFFLILIPIFIHLFQLRKFKKTPFTNVKFLQKVVAESRRSSSLKKWLLLFTRMLLFAVLILAFAQPFFAEKSALKTKETVIYLDDSFSMQAKANNASLLENAIQELITSVPETQKISVFTNQSVFKNVTIKSLQNDLLGLVPTAKQLNLDDIYLKANTFFTSDESVIKNLVLISDFQQSMAQKTMDSSTTVVKHLVRMSAGDLENVSIDSVYINTQGLENIELTALISTNSDLESIPVSLFNGESLVAKTAATFSKNKKAKVNFTLPKQEAIKGKIELSDSGLAYDNQFYFNIDSKEKIKVLAIGSEKSDYLERVFSNDDFKFISYSLKRLNYSDLNDQNLIILNELESIPNALATSLRSFTQNNGNLIIIPNTQIDFNSYNQLASNFFATNFTQKVNYEREITNISFSHPLYKNVFEKNVTNFQYPKVSQYFRVKTQAPNILAYQDKDPFLCGSSRVFIFTASLSTENSNFKNSPLIVPTLYNMGINSLKLPDLYYSLGSTTSVDIPVQLTKDRVLKVAKDGLEFIPQQKSFANKVSLSFYENPKSDGIFSVMSEETLHKNLSFNYTRAESELNYLDVNNIKGASVNDSVQNLFEQMENDNAINELWKWFVILALLFMLIEVLIQKFL